MLGVSFIEFLGSVQLIFTLLVRTPSATYAVCTAYMPCKDVQHV